jgi:hypothetical protein
VSVVQDDCSVGGSNPTLHKVAAEGCQCASAICVDDDCGAFPLRVASQRRVLPRGVPE